MAAAANDLRFDLDLAERDIQGLSSADALAAFFARLGYDTNARIVQTPGNLGIAADSTLRPINRIELIADREGLFQVYLFELKSVTVAHARALARAFRNRAGNFLLMLTSDYERLDFVLIERYLPPATPGAKLGERQVGIRPRTLTVERRNPGRRALRVLKRLTWTEPDSFAQYDKLLAAYAVADWAEEHFNNRALFSDYYLLERLREFPEWRDNPKPAFTALRALYRATFERFAGKPVPALRTDLIEPALAALGFEARSGKAGASHETPDYRLHAPGGKDALAWMLVYPWARSLDGKDAERDSETPDENPGAMVVSLLEQNEVPWVVVTNGRLWRLYARETHSRATNYYELDADELLADTAAPLADPGEAFRYFWLLFRRQAFEKHAAQREGKTLNLSLLDRLLLESEDYARELGSRLKDRVFEDVFPHIAHGFVDYLRAKGGPKGVPQAELDAIYQGTLTLLYRLLFLLYAEARDLLPVREVRGYWEASLARMKKEVAEHAGEIDDEVEAKLKKAYRDDEFTLWDRLQRLFSIVDRGDAALNVPFYNGGLFLTEPQDDDDTPEAIAARFLAVHKVADRGLAWALDLLSRTVDDKRHSLVSIDYKSLGVRQLGSIYEGLLEFKVRIAAEKLGIVKEKGREVYVPWNEIEEKAQVRAEHTGRLVRKGATYLENDKRERKASGSYYTPDYIVEYIVEHAVGPVIAEKFDKMRPKLRAAQAERNAFFQKQKALEARRMSPEPAEKAERIGEELVDELFDVKVLDPAMGSGHFLVEAVDFTTDRMLTFLNAFPWNPVQAYLARMRSDILTEADKQGVTLDPAKLTDVNLLKRHVLKRCIYGVDLNPMAVELAKVSLWLDCFTLGAPLSFLDHHLRCGNSLIGISEKQFEESQKRWGQMDLLGGSQYVGAKMAVGAMIAIGALPDITPAQTRESRKQYGIAGGALAPVRRLFDVYASQWFGKVLVFTYYKDTARYLYRHLGHPENPAAQTFCAELGGLRVRRMDSGADAKERLRIVEGFAPRSNGRPDWTGTEREIDLLISTDVLSEGQNLQDCGLLLNYDLHWNPTRMVQRAGRIDRIGSEFEELWIYNMFPDAGLERLLKLVESLSAKISAIDQAGFHDASVLGELVHPQNFNTLRRIREEDGSVIQEEEQAIELVSNESLAHQLRQMLDGGAREMVEGLPDGIHSGLVKPNAKGVFFYFQVRRGEDRQHFWRYCDLKTHTILDNRYLVANVIQCEPSTPRVVEPSALSGVFALQEEVIADILKSVAEQKALESAPRTIDPVQQTVATAIQGYLNHPDLDRKEAIELIRLLNQPMLSIQIKQLRAALRNFKTAGQVQGLIEEVQKLRGIVAESGPPQSGGDEPTSIRREDLRLICFEFVGGG